MASEAILIQVPFADDLRKFTFRSLDKLVSKKGEIIKKHPHIPTEEQMAAMDKFVDAMDLMDADKDEEGYAPPNLIAKIEHLT